jgi:hypothetical protein
VVVRVRTALGGPRDTTARLSGSYPETHQDYSPVHATCCHSLPLGPCAMMASTCTNGCSCWSPDEGNAPRISLSGTRSNRLSYRPAWGVLAGSEPVCKPPVTARTFSGPAHPVPRDTEAWYMAWIVSVPPSPRTPTSATRTASGSAPPASSGPSRARLREKQAIERGRTQELSAPADLDQEKARTLFGEYVTTKWWPAWEDQHPASANGTEWRRGRCGAARQRCCGRDGRAGCRWRGCAGPHPQDSRGLERPWVIP